MRCYVAHPRPRHSRQPLLSGNARRPVPAPVALRSRRPAPTLLPLLAVQTSVAFHTGRPNDGGVAGGGVGALVPREALQAGGALLPFLALGPEAHGPLLALLAVAAGAALEYGR